MGAGSRGGRGGNDRRRGGRRRRRGATIALAEALALGQVKARSAWGLRGARRATQCQSEKQAATEPGSARGGSSARRGAGRRGPRPRRRSRGRPATLTMVIGERGYRRRGTRVEGDARSGASPVKRFTSPGRLTRHPRPFTIAAHAPWRVPCSWWRAWERQQALQRRSGAERGDRRLRHPASSFPSGAAARHERPCPWSCCHVGEDRLGEPSGTAPLGAGGARVAIRSVRRGRQRRVSPNRSRWASSGAARFSAAGSRR